MLKNGSCAIEGCEPCQVGNQAALSGLLDVPQGCLFGAGGTKLAWIQHSILRCMVLFYSLFFIFLMKGEVYASGTLQKMASADL